MPTAVSVSITASAVTSATSDKTSTTAPVDSTAPTADVNTDTFVTSGTGNSSVSVRATTINYTTKYNGTILSTLPASHASSSGTGFTVKPYVYRSAISPLSTTNNAILVRTTAATTMLRSPHASKPIQHNSPTTIVPQVIPPGTGPTGAGGSATVNKSLKQCGSPPNILHATITSSEPYNVQSSAVYACISGYTLAGAASILCGTDLKWSGSLPQCIQTNNQDGTRSHTGLEEELSGLPLWLAIIVGVTVGVICLLLLTCLLMLCLKVFGCWKGSLFGDDYRRSVQVYPEKLENLSPKPTGKVSKSYSMAQFGYENERHVTSIYGNGRPPDDHRLPARLDRRTTEQDNRKRFKGNNSSKIGQANPLSPPLVSVTYGRQAKMPEGRKWMPHSHGVRNFNTSTK